MHNPDWRHALLGSALIIGSSATLACGPDFQLRLLGDRQLSLSDLPEGNFAVEAARLGQPVAGLGKASEATLQPWWDEDNQRYIEQRDELEQVGLSSEQAARLAELRRLTDPATAEAAASDLPAELRLYNAGAVAFAQGDWPLAADYFRRLLALPASERALRSTWAAYSLGRALTYQSETASNAEDAQARQQTLREQASAAFAQTRALSSSGFADPLELGIASLGEQARLQRQAGDWDSAIRLYASQMLHDSPTGYSSLKQLARELGQMPEEQLSPLLQQPAVAGLLAAFLFSHLDWSYGEQPEGRADYVLRLLQRGDGLLAEADRLAALSYQHGDYQGARQFLQRAGDSGLAWWLRAKLALQDGDKNAARDAYAKAAKAFPDDEQWGFRRAPDWSHETVKPRCRVEGESAILALERGDYLQAFELLYASGDLYWYDTAEVAERVLTLDELKRFVDQHVPAPAPEQIPATDSYEPLPVAARLRELLGRRLLRAEHWDEAADYFARAELQQQAHDYAEAREQGQSRWSAIGQAEALYRAGLLARQHGMELLGSEMGPDYQVLGGSYSFGPVQLQPGPWLSKAEASRQLEHLPQPNLRYHYRYLAATLAEQAAERLPHSSQAYAATLCQGTGWVEYVDLASARRLYRQYVENGPYVPWAANFGHQCQEPDFTAAQTRQWREQLNGVRHNLSQWKWPLFGVAGVLLAGGIAWWRRRTRSQGL